MGKRGATGSVILGNRGAGHRSGIHRRMRNASEARQHQRRIVHMIEENIRTSLFLPGDLFETLTYRGSIHVKADWR